MNEQQVRDRLDDLIRTRRLIPILLMVAASVALLWLAVPRGIGEGYEVLARQTMATVGPPREPMSQRQADRGLALARVALDWLPDNRRTLDRVAGAELQIARQYQAQLDLTAYFALRGKALEGRIEALSRAPLSTEAWLLVANDYLALGEPMELAIAALRMSRLTGPREGLVIVNRLELWSRLWPRLPEAYRHDVRADLDSLLYRLSTATQLRYQLDRFPPSFRSVIDEQVARQEPVIRETWETLDRNLKARGR